jgi:hypothetical protein
VNSSVFQLSIAVGSFLGGLAVDTVNRHSSLWPGLIILPWRDLRVAAVGRRDPSLSPSETFDGRFPSPYKWAASY